MSAHVDSNLKSIINEFDSIVGDEFNYQKINKDNWVKSDSYKSGGYAQSIEYYQIPFENTWIQDLDSDDLYKMESLREIFDEWCGQQYFTHTMNPRIDDYGNVDDKEMNIDIKNLLLRYLS